MNCQLLDPGKDYCHKLILFSTFDFGYKQVIYWVTLLIHRKLRYRIHPEFSNSRVTRTICSELKQQCNIFEGSDNIVKNDAWRIAIDIDVRAYTMI